jgi:hypothetical protein
MPASQQQVLLQVAAAEIPQQQRYAKGSLKGIARPSGRRSMRDEWGKEGGFLGMQMVVREGGDGPKRKKRTSWEMKER